MSSSFNPFITAVPLKSADFIRDSSVFQAISNYFLHSFLIMTIELGWFTYLEMPNLFAN